MDSQNEDIREINLIQERPQQEITVHISYSHNPNTINSVDILQDIRVIDRQETNFYNNYSEGVRTTLASRYQTLRNRSMTRLRSLIYQHFFQSLQNNQQEKAKRLQQLLKRIKSRVTRKKIGSCSICCQKIQPCSRIAIVQCKHKYHYLCLKKWLLLKSSCPLCRKEI